MGQRSIGGYFELESRFESEYHAGLVRLNSGRNCLEYILRANHYRKIYLPVYSCSALLEPILKLNLEFEWYAISSDLEPIQLKPLKEDECLLVINYFGLKGRYIAELSKMAINLIVDNSQAFFELPLPKVDTFYSARKFFGVPDGAYLSTNLFLEEEFEKEVSWNRTEHLLRRFENGAMDGYSRFLKNEEYLCGLPIKYMSNFTTRILAGINYKSVVTRRNQNFQYLNLKLKHKNNLSFSDTEIDGPMTYPLYVEKDSLREELIKQEIFVPTYWPNILENSKADQVEYQLSKYIIPLPVDQRYGLLDMDRICNVINSVL
ncbi:hypothetical protein [Ancylomarina longa]|uniref:DegT/DnrJ/EryC1/StrS aminotransferase family protein n=1 Tax=Ancylomarina longa TaxID=2487017 RepID=A0A434ATX4_9BACT|nr:hypothetical protein [Ancylomarina longa]RUT77874.1 hypothetical protein DLK05_11080 [Ancylomarina longa]